MEAVVYIYTHYILPTGERVLRSGSHTLPEGAEEIKSGASYPAMMNWMARHFEWAFRFIPLNLISVATMPEDEDDVDPNIIWGFDNIGPVDGHKHFVTWTQDDRQVVLSIKGKGAAANVFVKLGLIVLAAAKTPKRLKELARLSYMALDEPLIVAECTNFQHSETDGRGAIKLSTALRMLEACNHSSTFNRVRRGIERGKIVVMGFRYHTPGGQLKLEVNIVPDHIFIAKHGKGIDLAVHAEEWKQELKTSDGFFAHAWPKEHVEGPAFADVQTMSWMQNWMFPEAEVREWVKAMFNKALAAIREGELPKWMEVNLVEDEDGYEYARTNDLQMIAKQHVKWQLWGMDLKNSNNLVYMAWLSLKQRALARDIYVPIPYAARHHVCTRTFVTELCGYKIKSRPLDVINYDPRVRCMVYSSWLFTKLADSHGGWDQDGDSAVFPLRVAEGNLERDGEIYIADGDVITVPWRNPDSPGEYSIVKVDKDTIPVFFDDLGVDMPSVSMKNRPKFLHEVRAGVDVRDLPAPKKGKRVSWNKKFARELFEAQQKNPHIGRVANIYMVMSALGISPEWTYAMEAMVDACMGEPCEEAFEAIEEWITYGWELVREHGRVDRFFSGTLRVNSQSNKVKGRIPADVLADLELYDGYFTRLHRFVVSEAMEYGENLGKLSLELRRRNPIGDLAQDGYFPTDEHTKALVAKGRTLITWSEKEYARVARTCPRHRDEFNPMEARFITGPVNKARRSEESKEIVRGAVRSLLRLNPVDRVTVLVAAYRFCMESTDDNPNGKTDRILYAHAGEDEVSVMDLWLGVLARLGFADPEPVIRGEMVVAINEALASLDLL